LRYEERKETTGAQLAAGEGEMRGALQGKEGCQAMRSNPTNFLLSVCQRVQTFYCRSKCPDYSFNTNEKHALLDQKIILLNQQFFFL
jgi:hypothetical protein